jgi:hypothetical protein
MKVAVYARERPSARSYSRTSIYVTQAHRQSAARRIQTASHPNELTLDGATNRYVENVATKSSKTSSGYRYTCSSSMPQLYDLIGYLRREGLFIARSTTASVRWLRSCVTSASRT